MSTLYIKGNTIYIGYTDQYGVRTKGRTTKIKAINKNGILTIPPEAYRLQKQIDTEISLGIFGIQQRATKTITISEAHLRYTDTEAKTFKQGTKKNTETAIKKFIAILGDKKLGAYTTDDLYKFRNELLDTMTDHGASFYLRAIRPIFSWAVRNNYLPANPFTKKIMVKARTPMPLIVQPFWLDTILAQATKDDQQYLNDQLTFLIMTGWRSGESCELQWSHIAWADKFIIRINEKGTRYEKFPLYDTLVTFLKTLPHTYAPYVFHYRSDSGIHNAWIKLIEKINEKALKEGTPQIDTKFKVHTLRKYFSTYLQKNGVPTAMVSEMLGHRDQQTTKNHYTAFGQDDMISILNQVTAPKSNVKSTPHKKRHSKSA